MLETQVPPAPAADVPFALGVFSPRDARRAFTGLVRPDGWVTDLSTTELAARFAATAANLSPQDLFSDWDRALVALTALNSDSRRDAGARRYPLAALEVLAPLAPGQIVQSGANYRTHVIDLAIAHFAKGVDGSPDPQAVAKVRAETAAMMDRRIAEGSPYLFIGLPSAVTGPYDDVTLPGYSQQHDWELELAVVIGRPAWRVTRQDALSHVAAYTIGNDLTTRDLVFRRDMPDIGTDWLRSKNAPGFLPLGPYLVPAAFVANPMDLRLTLSLNGAVMQDESTKDMIFDVAALIVAASQIVRLSPGDLILTGSPAGNGIHHGRLLRDGDVMEATISGLGTQRTRCIAEPPHPVSSAS